MTLYLNIERDTALSDDRLRYVIEGLYGLERAVGKVLTNKKDPEYYNNAPWSFAYFMEGLEHIKSSLPPAPKLLDVGCGTGTKCFLANKLGFLATGLDTNADYLKIAEEIGIDTICADAFDYKEYDKYDVIYWYLPIRKLSLMEKLEEVIFTLARPGAILFPAFPFLGGCSKNSKMVKLRDALAYYVKD